MLEGHIEFFNEAWLATLEKIYSAGKIVHPRGQETREIVGTEMSFSMRYPVLTLLERRLGYKFMCAEAAWILRGDNRVSSLAPYSREVPQYSNDGVFFNGAYGPKVVDQLTYVVGNLKKDRDSRQAVMGIWRENPRDTFDTPCTLNLQWLIRDKLLHCIVNMRSSDIWLGVPYDVFSFSMLSGVILLLLKSPEYSLGRMLFRAGSQHLYARHYDRAHEILQAVTRKSPSYFNPYDFSNFEELKTYLQECSDGRKDHGFLKQVFAQYDTAP